MTRDILLTKNIYLKELFNRFHLLKDCSLTVIGCSNRYFGSDHVYCRQWMLGIITGHDKCVHAV